jgi:hypothetical protein
LEKIAYIASWRNFIFANLARFPQNTSEAAFVSGDFNCGTARVAMNIREALLQYAEQGNPFQFR